MYMKLLAIIGVGADETEKSEIRNFAPLVRYPKKKLQYNQDVSVDSVTKRSSVYYSL